MKCKILHESKGRIRVHFCQKYMTLHQADMAEYALSTISSITKVQVIDRTCDVIISEETYLRLKGYMTKHGYEPPKE